MDLNQVIEEFGDAVERGVATVLVGAGLSVGAGYPGWSDLMQPFLEECGLPPDYDDLPQLAQWVVNSDGNRDRLVGHVVEELNKVGASATSNHHLLAELPIEEIWTTNYDQMLELATGGHHTVEVDNDLVTADLGRKRIYKMHGSIREAESEPVGGVDALVLTRDDYDLYEQRHPRMWRLLQAEFLTKSFLFLGFSMSDPNFHAVCRLVRVATPEQHMKHFALLRPDARNDPIFGARALDLERSGVFVAAYEDHAQVTDFLEKLVARTKPTRLYVSGSHPRSSGDTPPAEEGAAYPTPATTDDSISAVASLLGRNLADAGVKLATGGVLGAEVGYSMIDALGERYSPAALWVLRRNQAEPLETAPNHRLGTIIFTGTEPGELRDEVFRTVRAVVVLHGSEGTRQEIARAREQNMGIVPLAITRGAAQECWEEMLAHLDSFTLGGHEIDRDLFERLGNDDPEIATDAAMRLIKQAMFIKEPI